jgi:hypothetical protein
MLTTRTAVRPDAVDTTSGETHATPSPELVLEASQRLGWAALIYASAYSVAYFGPHLVAWLTEPGYPFWRTQNIFAIVSVTSACGVFWLARRAVLPPQRLLDLGLVFG